MAPDGTTCCLPSSSDPGWVLVCRQLPSQEECARLAETVTRPHRKLGEASFFDEDDLPVWQDVLVPWIQLPLASFCVLFVLFLVFRKVHLAIASRYGEYERFLIKNVGNINHLPQNPWLMTRMHSMQIFASIVSVFIWVLHSSATVPLPILYAMEKYIGLLLLVDVVINAFKMQFMVAALFTHGVLIDMLTLPAILLQFWVPPEHHGHSLISLNFLRSIKAVLAYESIVLLNRVHLMGPLALAFCRLGLRLLALIICFASSILLLEVLGELPYGPERKFKTEMGEISTLVMVYWIVETLSTVGYGDYAPKTMLSRFATMCCMIVGIIFFGVEVTKIQKLLSKLKQGSGQYEQTHCKHVVLLGGGVRQIDENLIIGFVDELFHASCKKSWPDLVVMSSNADGIANLQIVFEEHFQTRQPVASPLQRITYLVGSPLQRADLVRCRCDKADMVYIIPNTNAQVPQEEDKFNILRTLNLRKSFPGTSLRLVLLSEQSLQMAMSAGIRPVQCFSINEFRGNMLFDSCRCPGWCTMFINLMATVTQEEESAAKLCKPWVNRYIRGRSMQIYGFVPHGSFIGKPLQFLIMEAFRKTHVCVFAAQVGDGQMRLAPLDSEIKGTTVCWALAASREDLAGMEQDGKTAVDWRDLFRKNRHRGYVKKAKPSCDKSDQVLTRVEGANGEPASPSKPASFVNRSGTMVSRVEEVKEFAARMIERAEVIKSAAGDIPFILILNLASSWTWADIVIKRSRAAHLPIKMPIIVLCPKMPAQNQIDALLDGEGPEVVLLEGSPTVERRLLEAGVKECSSVICCGSTSGDTHTIDEMVDADVVMVYRLLLHLGQENKHIVLEFKRVRNMSLLASPVGADADQDPDELEKNADFNWFHDERYVSGMIFTPHVLGSLLGSSYRALGLFEIMQRLLMPDRRESGVKFLWQVLPRPSYFGRRYEYVFERLVEEGALPLGLLRIGRPGSGDTILAGAPSATGSGQDGSYTRLLSEASDSEAPEGAGSAATSALGVTTEEVWLRTASYRAEGEHSLKYVLTNPCADELIGHRDLIFILAGEAFGQQAREEGLLATPASIIREDNAPLQLSL